MNYDAIIQLAEHGAARFMRLYDYRILGDADDVRQSARLHALAFIRSPVFTLEYVENRVYLDLKSDLINAINNGSILCALEPSSVFDAIVDETNDEALELLDGLNELDQEIVKLKLAKHTNAAIMRALGMSRRQLDKRLDAIRRKLIGRINNN